MTLQHRLTVFISDNDSDSYQAYSDFFNKNPQTKQNDISDEIRAKFFSELGFEEENHRCFTLDCLNSILKEMEYDVVYLTYFGEGLNPVLSRKILLVLCKLSYDEDKELIKKAKIKL